MENKRDYYEVLGISKSATQQEIKRAFRKKAMKYHPDRNKDFDAEDKFKEINEAYEVLHDSDKREKYDRFGHSAFQQGGAGGFGGFDFGGFNFNDIFNEFFGGGQRPNGPMKGDDYQMQVHISFMDSIHGKTLREKLEKYQDGFKVKKDVEVEIPAGIRNGMSVRVPGFGGVGSHGGAEGDLYIKVIINEHKLFKRDGFDIHVEMPVTFYDIISEKQVNIPTPYGSVETKLNKRMDSNTIITIPKKGVKALRNNYYGNLVVHLKMVMPKLSMREEAHIKEMAKKTKDHTNEKWHKRFKYER